MATFTEYLNDFATNDTKMIGEDFLQNELSKIEEVTRKKTETMIERVDDGERDIYL